jgi:flavin-dependent dehydrogenase
MKPITIAGAGLAGLSLANTLQAAGVATTLHEAHTLPRHRVCGEFICGKGADSLARQGLSDTIAGAHPHRSIEWFVRARCVLKSTLPSPAYGISRYETDQRLANRFEAAGGRLICQSRWSVAPEDGVVNCSGRQSTRSDWIGLKLHSQNFVTSADLEMHMGDQGYIGLSGIEHGRTNICALFKLRPDVRSSKETLLLAYLRACGLTQLAERIGASQIDPLSHVGVAGIAFSQLPAPRPGSLQLGDAYSVIPPFTGNGMSIAIESAEIAHPILMDYATGMLSWNDACRSIHLECRQRFKSRLKVAQALHPWLTQSKRHKVLAALGTAKILPFRLLYALTH